MGRQLSHGEVLRLAVPVMLSNLSTPLLGAVDTAIVGRLPGPAHLGAVALGATIFSVVFWAFGFLRMGTTGLVAQALGADDEAEAERVLTRAMLVAFGIGLVLWTLQVPIASIAFWLVEGSAEVEALAQGYFSARIWAAPATLANYAVLGWLVGRGKTGQALLVQLVLNGSNMLLDGIFVLHFDWGVAGVGWGTALSQYAALGVGLLSVGRLRAGWVRRSFGRRDLLLASAALRRTFGVSFDIMVRSLALMAAFSFFVAEGAKNGDALLAGNAVLMVFVNIGSYFLDGIAHATEVLVGRALGARDRTLLRDAMLRTTGWALAMAACLSVVFFVGRQPLLALLTDEVSVRRTALEFAPWAAAAPVAGVLAYQLDGIFIGATQSRSMRNAMVVSLGIFLGAYWGAMAWGKPVGALSNHVLWGSLFVHYLARTVTLAWPLRRWRDWVTKRE